MFFLLSKILLFLLSPVFWIMLLFLLGLLGKKQQRKKWFLISTFSLLVIFTNPFLGNLAVKKWEIPYRKVQTLTSNYDYGIVLGGMSEWDEDFDRLIFAGSTDRLIQAIDLYKQGIIKKILISSGSGSVIYTEEREAIYLKDFLLRNGFPVKDLVIEPDSRNTHENAVNTAKMLLNQHSSNLLITSAIHMRRAAKCFQKIGLRVDTWSTDRLAFDVYKENDIDNLIIPSAQILRNWEKLIKEVVGYGTYRVMGYL